MKIFEWNEASAIACSAGILSPEGTLPDSAAVLELLRNIPKAQNACETWFNLPHETKGWIAPFIYTGRSRGYGPVVSSLSAAAEHLSDPAVLVDLQAISENTGIDFSIRLLANAMCKSAGDDDTGNIVGNGSLETEEHDWAITYPTYGRVSRSDEVALRGSHSLKCDINHGNYHIAKIIKDAKPHTQYYFSAWVFIPTNQPVAEGRLNIRGSPAYRKGNVYRNLGHTVNIPDIVLTPGQWTYVSCIIPGAGRRTDSLRLVFALKNFERGDVVYVDDVQVLAIPNAENKK